MIENARIGLRSKWLLLVSLTLTAFVAGPPRSIAKEVSSALEVARQLNQAFVDVAERVSPTVVVIEVTQRADADSNEDDPLVEMLPPELRRRYEEYLEKRRNAARSGQHSPPIAHGRGSGIIIRKDGYILTNTHVVEDAETIKVQLMDGRQFDSKKVWIDPQSDIAVIKIDARDLPEAKFGDSAKASVGEFAIAIGAPYVLDYSVTFGHISAKGRNQVIPSWAELGAKMDQDFIQTDASINPGNSGGPLVNIEGEVIGINTLIRGIGTGIGFAVPSNLAKDVSDHLIKEGKFARAWLGIGIEPLKESEFRTSFKGIENGVIVKSIQRDGPASRSKLKPFDLITSVEGKPVGTTQELRQAVRSKEVGSILVLDVVRPMQDEEFKNLKIHIKTEEWLEAPPVIRTSQKSATQPEASHDPGLTVQSITKENAAKYKIQITDGVLVTDVKADSLAANFGLRPGDIITEVNHKPVKTPKQFREAIKSSGPQGPALTIVSRGGTRFEVLKDGD